MKAVAIIEMLRKNIKTLKKVMIVYLAALVVFDVSLPREDAHYLIDKVYAFWTLFGIVGCYLLIKFSKGMAHLLLAKKEDYYHE